MRKTIFTLLVAAWMVALVSWTATAQQSGTVTITARVVDSACYLGHNMQGSNHTKCAEMCAKNGIPLLLLDTKTNKLFLPVSMDHSNPNAKLLPYVEKLVKVTGKTIEKGGITGIVISSISPAD